MAAARGLCAALGRHAGALRPGLAARPVRPRVLLGAAGLGAAQLLSRGGPLLLAAGCWSSPTSSCAAGTAAAPAPAAAAPAAAPAASSSGGAGGEDMVHDVLWLATGGLLQSALYALGGAGFCVTLVGIPWGMQCFKLGYYCLRPFAPAVAVVRAAPTPLTVALNLVWLPVGVALAASHGVLALATALTVVGLPFSYTHLRLAVYALCPFGLHFVPANGSSASLAAAPALAWY
jgi:uncharacterized membrane protein YccF (DUF307 family)